ncbi:hypothetical protein [Nocardioides sp. URHA0020]|uniref:hypothetical protein n=1 Tax=Nocardioides sp. URHA0020 TaxID=1380392 RepID=UPI00048C75D6|nr:hypothetical protein [Nocardioides sp. URHA0020]
MHLLPRRAARPVDRAVAAVRRWPVESQQRSRRNAMIASTALAQRRAELHDVEDFLAARGHSPAPEVAAQAAHG